MLLDGFLHLLDGGVEVGVAYGAAAFVAYGIQGYQLRVVVFVALFLVIRTIEEGL